MAWIRKDESFTIKCRKPWKINTDLSIIRVRDILDLQILLA